MGGWSFYTKDGKAKFGYNFLGVQTFTAEAGEPVPEGKHQLRAEFAYDGGGMAKGGNVSLFYDGNRVGEGRVQMTQPLIFSGDETADIGIETGTPVVAADYNVEASRFTGEISWGGAKDWGGRPDAPGRP
jgi:hypothetical protein